MTLYKDQIEKITYYKERIMQDLTKKGIYPDNLYVAERIASIDTKLSLFKHKYVSPGEKFNTQEMNESMLLIAEDLKILYLLVYRMSIEKYNELKSYLEGHLQELQAMAKKYEYKTKFEIDSTSLGKTIFFQANGFNTSINNTIATIELGSIEADNASKLSCIFDGDNISPENVVFSFDGKNCSPYSFNRDFFSVPGDVKTMNYDYTLPENEHVASAHIMNIPNFTPSPKNKYFIYGGHDYVALRYGFKKRESGTPFKFSSPGIVTFYVLNSTYINFDFSSQPLSKNFNDTSINKPQKCQKITMEYEAGFSFDFITDGTCYATRNEGIIKDNKLYYPNGDDLTDFLIEEFYGGNKTTFKNVSVVISSLTKDTPLKINTIAIKELSSMEGVK